MLDGERRQVGVGDEGRPDHVPPHEGGEDLTVPVGGHGDPRRRAGEPLLHLAPGVRHGPRSLEDAWIRDEPHEGQQRRPGQPDPLAAAQLPVQPGARGGVLGEPGDVSVDEQVRVQQDQR